MANVGVVYSTNTGRIRRWFRPDVPGRETIGVVLLPGEAITVLPQQDLASMQAAVNVITGKVPSGDRYAIVPVGPTATVTITEVHVMDPLIDTIPNGMQAIAHPTVSPGYTYSSVGGIALPALAVK